MSVWIPKDDGYARLESHDSFIKGVPHNSFKRLRDEEPCHWTDWDGGKGFWSITRYQDIILLNRMTDIFSSAQGIRMEDQTEEEYLARRTFQELDPPDHTVFRMKVAKAFSKPVIDSFEQQIREICHELLDEVILKQEFDATADLARKLPMKMLGRIVGLPEEDLEWLVSKGDELISNTDPDYTDHLLDKMDTDAYRLMPFNSPAGAELYDYARELMLKKEASGDTKGILHMILQPDKNGDTISQIEFGNFFCLLVAAGNDTTRYSLAASIHALANQKDLLPQLQKGRDIWKTAPDEMIRWASPTMYFRRTAQQDYSMHGKLIKKGDKVMLWFVSANRDERAFEDPFKVNPTRSPNHHLAFGQGGPHVCLGMWLAKLEVKILLEELVKRVKSIEQVGEVSFLRSNFIGGIKKLPVRVVAL